MRYDNRRNQQGNPRQSSQGGGMLAALAGASRYLTHLIILVITVAAALLATTQLPRMTGSDVPGDSAQPPSDAALIDPNQPGALLVPQRGDGVSAGAVTGDAVADDGSIVRSFAPMTGTAQTDDAASADASSRELINYSVQEGDTLFGIASAYGLTPETILWSNYKALKDNPDLLSIGMDLVIPPSNGLVAVVEDGDTIEAIARRFKVAPEAIVEQQSNSLTSVNQLLQVGQELFVPGGERETVIWQVPTPVEVSRNAVTGVRTYRVGRCGEVAIPALGTGGFIFPTNRRYLSGYNFSGWHPGLDFAGRLGEPIYAADSGTVIYAGYSLNAAGVPVGYGQYVVLDHGNGYQTLYAHASQLYVNCGQQVLQGSVIAGVGSIGKSTGPHLHFEIRAGGLAINPWGVLPAP